MRILPAAVALTLMAAPALHATLSQEENVARLRQLDRDHDKRLDAAEVDLGLWYRAHPGKVDLKDPPSTADIQQKSAKDAVFQLLRYEFEQDHGRKSEYAFDELQADKDFRLPKAPAAPATGPTGKAPEPPVVPKGRFLLRRGLDKISTSFAESDDAATEMAKSPAKLADQGALFSYGRHFPSGTDQWTADGVLAYEQPFVGGLFGATSLGRWLFSASFSRVDFGGDIKKLKLPKQFRSAESSLLALGVTSEALVNWPQGVAGFTGSSLRLNGLWKTDWDLESQIPTGELEWTFYNGRLGIGSFNTTCDLLYWRFDAALHVDGGHVAADGKWTKSHQGDTFGHIGPKIGLSIMPFPQTRIFQANPLLLSLSFAQYERFTDDSKEVRRATADAAWYLRKPNSGSGGPFDPGVALTLSYRHFHNVENEQSDDSLILGLAIGL